MLCKLKSCEILINYYTIILFIGASYGFLWNMPNYGGVDFAKANTSEVRWTAVSANITDYFVTIPETGAAPSGAANQIMHSQ